MQQKAASQFVDVLENQQLLSPDIIEELRRQISDSKSRLTPELIAKLLVDNGHLTKFQATKLVSGMKEGEEPAEDASDNPASPSQDESELGFADDSALLVQDAAEGGETAAVAAVILDDEPPADVVAVDVVEEPVAVVAESVVEVVAEPQAAVVEVVAETPTPSDTGPSDALGGSSAPKPAKPKKTQMKKANPWDSFRILGVGLILALTCIAGFFLVRWLVRGNAEDYLERADNSYEQRSYEDAGNLYTDFSKNWPTHEKASFANVRAALAQLRRDSESVPNPSVGLATALEVLPPISNEAGLAEQRDDLTGALIGLAGKFTERADSRETTAERRELMDEMAKVMALIDDPTFVGQAQRKRQEPTLVQIQEKRDRILREINRDDALQAALGKMDERLGENDTVGSYAIRGDLIAEYPILEANPAVVERVQAATKIQMALVEDGQLNPRVSDSEPESDIGKSYLLGHREGGTARTLEDTVLFVKVKGSVYGLDGGTGTILWRKYVGSEFHNEPIRVEQAGEVDALICQPELGIISRVAGRTGETKWFVNAGTPIHMPVVESDDLYFTTLDGEVASLDLQGGQTMWTKKLPQPISSPPGVAFNKSHLYVPGDHTNLYVLSRQDGACAEVVYLGQRKGAVQVAPTLHKGHLFVCENYKSDKAKVRKFATDDQGLNLIENERPEIMEGNIVVDPKIDRRRITVLTDLGEISILDVELATDDDKVTELTERGKIEFEPTLSWLVSGDNALWVVDSRFTRIDVRESMGQLEASWTKHNADQFTGPPQYFDDTVVHARVLNGNQGVRVAAVNAKSGEAFWEIDLGVPVTGIVSVNNKYRAFNSCGMMFVLDGNDKRSEANFNAGQGKFMMNFGAPISVGNEQVLLNRSQSNQLAITTPNGQMEKLVANFGTGNLTFHPVVVEDQLAVGLNSGQVLLLNPKTGAVSSPYQPAMKAGEKISWNRPVYFADSNSLVIGGSNQTIVKLGVGNSLRALTEVELESPLVSGSPLAKVGSTVAVVAAGSGGDKLQILNPQNLSVVAETPLDSNWIAGPFGTDQQGYVQSKGDLMAFDESGQETWKIPFPASPLVGPPLPQGANLIFATKSGRVYSVNASTGEVVGTSDALQELTSTPTVLQNVLLFGSTEGAVLALPFPSGAEVQ